MQQNIDNLHDAIIGFDLGKEKPLTDIKTILNNIQTSELPGFKFFKTQEGHELDFYANAIEKLSQAADAEMGVHWKIDQDNNTLIRDARNTTGPVQNSVYAQLATAFNSARAADRMIRTDDKGNFLTDDALSDPQKKAIKNIKDKLVAITEEVSKGNVEKIDLKALNGFLVGQLKSDEKYKKTKDEKLLKQLNTTKDLAGLEDIKYNVATIYNQGNKVVYEADAIIPPLPENKVKDETFKNQVLDAQKDAFNKKMVGAYWDIVQANKGPFPTQTLGTLPGLRNAWIKDSGIIEDEKLTSFGKFIHTGTVSSGLKVKDNMIADINVQHMAKIAQGLNSGNEKIIIASLNTPLLVKTETQAVSQLNKAINNLNNPNISSALTPMNGMRRMVSSNTKSYDDALMNLGSKLENDNDPNKKTIGEYLQGKVSERSAREALNKIENELEKNTLLEAVRTKSAVKESFLGSLLRKMIGSHDKDDKGMSRSLRQTAGMITLTGLINNGALGESIKMPVISTHCKSGKDRTGAISIEVQRRFSQVHGIENNLEAQVQAGHVQKMAEFGGTPGNVGLKGHSGLSGKLYEKLLNFIGLKTAKNNKIDELSRGDIIVNAITMKDVNQFASKADPQALAQAQKALNPLLSKSKKAATNEAKGLTKALTKAELETSKKIEVKTATKQTISKNA